MFTRQVSHFKLTTEIFWGTGSIRKLPEVLTQLDASRVLIITDKGLVRSGVLDRVTRLLEKHQIKYQIFDEVEPNPSVETVNNGLVAYKDLKAQTLLAVGGGSPIDTAKAIGVLASNGGDITQYEGIDTFSKPIPPLVAVPTTAGTGSEVTTFTVITDNSRKYKLTVGGRKLAARYALVDPEMTRTVPPHITAATGLDALVHAIESYTSLASFELTEHYALEAIRLISRHLRQAVFNGENMPARTAVLLGSLMAGIAFNSTRLGNCHALSHPLSAIFGIPHGVANAILFPHIMEFNLPAAPERFVHVAQAMGARLDGLTFMEQANKAIEAWRELARDVGIPKTLREVGVDPEAIPKMAADAMLSGNIKINPRKTELQDVINLYRSAMGG